MQKTFNGKKIIVKVSRAKGTNWNWRRRCWVVVELARTNNMMFCQMDMECACCCRCYDFECIQHLNNAVQISVHSTERFVCFSDPIPFRAFHLFALRCVTLPSPSLPWVSVCVSIHTVGFHVVPCLNANFTLFIIWFLIWNICNYFLRRTSVIRIWRYGRLAYHTRAHQLAVLVSGGAAAASSF